MKHTFGKQASLAGIALAAAAVMAPGIANAQTAPVSGTTFVKGALSIETSTAGEAAVGGLACSWQEAGLHPVQLIPYACDADVVGGLLGCVSKNKLVGAAVPFTPVHHPLAIDGGPVGFVSNNKGRINGTTTTAVPVTEVGECTEPAEAQIVAVRWCNASLTDTTNTLVGATASELFQQFFSGLTATVPSCAQLLQ